MENEKHPRVMIRKTKETLEKITRYTYLYTPCPLYIYISLALSKLSTIQIVTKTHTDNHDPTRSFVIKGTGDSHLVYKENVRDIRGHLTRRGSITHAGSLSLDGATPTAASLLTNFPCNTLFEWRNAGQNFRRKFSESVETGQMRVRCALCTGRSHGSTHTHRKEFRH